MTSDEVLMNPENGMCNEDAKAIKEALEREMTGCLKYPDLIPDLEDADRIFFLFLFLVAVKLKKTPEAERRNYARLNYSSETYHRAWFVAKNKYMRSLRIY